MKRFALIAALVVACVPASAQISRSAPSEVEDALREQVTGFYTYFQKGEFRKAEAFLDEDSKDVFYGAKKNRIINFEIRTVDFGEDFRSAKVLVACETMVPMLGSKPLTIPLGSEWKYSEKGWLMHLRDPLEDKARVALAGSPFGQMQFSQDLPEPGKLAVQQQMAAPPTVESLASMYHVSAKNVRFIRSSTPTARDITIENRSRGKMTIERYSGETEGIEVKLDRTELESGETARLTITYRPDIKELKGRHRLDLMLMPINQMVTIVIDF